jgi:hypothetical protein
MWQLFCCLAQMTSGTAQIPLQDRKKEYVQAANLFKAGHVLLHPTLTNKTWLSDSFIMIHHV